MNNWMALKQLKSLDIDQKSVKLLDSFEKEKIGGLGYF